MTEPSSRLGALLEEAARVGFDLDSHALERFAHYLDLILEWNSRAGLTSVTDPDQVQRRHFGEALALLSVLRRVGILGDSGSNLIDIGSGAGLPGLPMCIVDRSLRTTLVESNSRRCRFLNRVVNDLRLSSVTVVCARAEDAGRDPKLRGHFDLAMARAVAPLSVLVEYALPFLRLGGLLVAPKGSRAESEEVDARAAISALGGSFETSLSLVLPPGVASQRVLLVRREGELDDRYPRRSGIPSKRPLS